MDKNMFIEYNAVNHTNDWSKILLYILFYYGIFLHVDIEFIQYDLYTYFISEIFYLIVEIICLFHFFKSGIYRVFSN